jgi:hypothetical protein
LGGGENEEENGLDITVIGIMLVAVFIAIAVIYVLKAPKNEP